jgi:hypothetical protein
MDFFALMPPRSPTFSERLRMTYALWSMRLPMPSVWIPIVWSIGATASLSPTGPQSAKLTIETANADRCVTVTISKRHQ